MVPHDGVVVSSYDERDGLIRAEYCWTDGNRLDVSTFPALPLNREGGGMQSRVIMSGEPLVFNDVPEVVKEPGGTYYDVDREGTFRKLPVEGPPPTQAAMMVPVKHEGKVVGVVQVMTAGTEFSPEQLEIVEGLVALMGAADRNARLHAERRRLEAAEATALAVAAERERAASVLDAVGDGIFLVDSDGVVRFWNRAAALITGRSADEACDRPAAETFADWESLAERIPVAEHGKSARSTTLPVTVGAWDLWLSFTAVHGRSGTVYTFRDLTAERGFDEQKSDLIATISHELRTPMAAVYGAAQTLLSREESLDSGEAPGPPRDDRDPGCAAEPDHRRDPARDPARPRDDHDPGGAGGRRRVVRSTLEAMAPDVPVEVDVSTEIGERVRRGRPHPAGARQPGRQRAQVRRAAVQGRSGRRRRETSG